MTLSLLITALAISPIAGPAKIESPTVAAPAGGLEVRLVSGRNVALFAFQGDRLLLSDEAFAATRTPREFDGLLAFARAYQADAGFAETSTIPAWSSRLHDHRLRAVRALAAAETVGLCRADMVSLLKRIGQTDRGWNWAALAGKPLSQTARDGRFLLRSLHEARSLNAPTLDNGIQAASPVAGRCSR